MDLNIIEIWPSESGITDLPADISGLLVPELGRIREQWQARRSALGDSDRLRIFAEQLSREWAIETGVIENLYDIERGVTQTLIEQGFQSAILEHGSTNRDPEYVLALIEDQKAALENLFSFVKQDRPLTVGYVRELHAMMTQSQETTTAQTPIGDVEVPLIKGDWKKIPNSPHKDGIKYGYCPPEQTAPEMERLVEMHVRHKEMGVEPEVEAAWLHHRFTQIHPFQDGNGRVARALASLVLIRAGLFPLIVPRDEKGIYLDSLERADSGNLRPLTLLVARRMQVAYQKALNVIDKFAPEPESMEEAAAMLGTVYSGRQEVVSQRLQGNLKRLHQLVYQELNTQSKRATDQMRKAAGMEDSRSGGGFGGGGFGGGRPSTNGPSIDVLGGPPERFFHIVRPVLMDRWEVLASRPCDCFDVLVRLGEEVRMIVHLHALNPETDESLQVAGLLKRGNVLEAIEVEPLTIHGNEPVSAIPALVSHWVQEFFRISLG